MFECPDLVAALPRCVQIVSRDNLVGMKSFRSLSFLFSLLGAIRAMAAAQLDTNAQVATQSPFRFGAVSGQSMGLWEGNRPVLVYNHGVISNSNAPSQPGRATYFHPIYGLDGEALTDDFPKDHDYHRGLYWAWPHIKTVDHEYDLWSLRGIRSEFRRWLALETNSNLAILAVQNAWLTGDQEVMLETVRVEIHRASAQSRAIDLELTWSPIGQPISLWGAPGKSYGGLTLRFGPRSKTIITVPSGRASEDLVMMKLPWADFCGDLNKAQGGLSGAAIFVHPQHPDFPPTWMTRHYGMLAVGWPGVEPKTFPAGKSFSCSYRLWIHRNALSSAEIQKAYDAYCAEAKTAIRTDHSESSDK